MSEAKVLAIGVNDEVIAQLNGVVSVENFCRIDTADQFFAEYETYNDGQFGAILCTTKFGPELAMEAGQVCRNQCVKTPSFCIVFDTNEFQPKLARKNGFSDMILLPADRHVLVEKLAQSLTEESLNKRMYKAVKVPDLKADTKLGFATYVYLPLNKKHLMFNSGNENLSEKKLSKLKDKQMGSLYIDQKSADQFYEYVANQFKSFGNGMSETERTEKMQDAVRGIFGEIFQPTSGSFEEGRDLADSCRKIVSTYVTGSAGNDLYARLLKTLGGQSIEYSHSADVSTFAALFGIAVGYKEIEDLALAGFLHDISLAQFALDHSGIAEAGWSEEDRKTFLNHPQASLELIKLKRMVISPNMEKMILQHHECFNGTGFPKGLRGDRVDEGAQILALADRFFYLTVEREGRERLSPMQAIDAIAAQSIVAPSLIGKVRKIMKAD
jgi:HD-GYP domain-containing protein (c-di-GMP phosphodiesterase class II)